MKNLQNRAYATVAATKVGSRVIPDGDFTCLEEGIVREVKEDDHGLYILCDEGKHYLDGQLSDDGTYYIGLYLERLALTPEGSAR